MAHPLTQLHLKKVYSQLFSGWSFYKQSTKTASPGCTYACVRSVWKRFQSKFGMYLHTKKFKYECTTCEKKFSQKRPYRYHCAKVHNVYVDKCHHCRKEFNSPESLSRHLAVCLGSTGSNKFKCVCLFIQFNVPFKIISLISRRANR